MAALDKTNVYKHLNINYVKNQQVSSWFWFIFQVRYGGCMFSIKHAYG
jgi:hypothetical protein